MQGIERFGKGSFFFGDTDKVNMISHETIGPDFKTVFLTIFLKPMKIMFEVIIIIENGVLIVTPLGDMVGIINSYGSCYSWHKRKNSKTPP